MKSEYNTDRSLSIARDAPPEDDDALGMPTVSPSSAWDSVGIFRFQRPTLARQTVKDLEGGGVFREERPWFGYHELERALSLSQSTRRVYHGTGRLR